MAEYRILIMGLPGSGKTTLWKKLKNIFDYNFINGDVVRTVFNDFDFSERGRNNQAKRMRSLCKSITIADFVCPTKKTREIFDAHFIVFMNTIEKSIYKSTNVIFEKPDNANIVINNFNYDIKHIEERIRDGMGCNR